MIVIWNIVQSLVFMILGRLLPGELRNKFLRLYGIRIGKRCLIYTTHFSTEPFLIDIGDHVVISSGTKFVTHDGAGWILHDEHPGLDLFGRIRIGDNTFIGIDSIILANTTIGSGCLIGAASVVRGNIPDNSVVLGNPGRVIMKTDIYKAIYLNHKNCLKTKLLTGKKRIKTILDHFNQNENPVQ